MWAPLGRGTKRADPVGLLVPLLTLAVFTNFLGSLALGPFLPAIAEEFEVSVALLGQVPALTMLLAALLGLVAGPLADAYGYRRSLLAGLGAVVISTLGTALAPSYPLLLAITLVGALGRAMVFPVAVAIVGERVIDLRLRRQAVGWVTAGLSGAAVLGIPILTTIAAGSDWRLAFWALGGLASVTALLLALLLDSDASQSRPRMGVGSLLAAYVPLLRHGPSLGLVGSALLGSAGVWTIWTYAAAFFVERHALSTQDVGWVYLATGAAVFCGNLVVGRGLAGLRPRPLVVATRAATGTLLGLALFIPLPPLQVVGLLSLAMLLTGMNAVASVELLVAESPGGRATTLTLNGSALSLGITLGAASGGLALILGAYPALGACAAGWLFAAALLAWASGRSGT